METYVLIYQDGQASSLPDIPLIEATAVAHCVNASKLTTNPVVRIELGDDTVWTGEHAPMCTAAHDPSKSSCSR
jgi:hypothetical protein